MARTAAELGYYSERVDDPAEVEPALKRALAQNAEGKPAYLEFIASQFPVYGPFVPAS